MQGQHKRTLTQNNAIHKYCDELSKALNEAGLDMRKVLKPGVSIPWSRDLVKKHLWKPIQDAMYEKRSTTQLNRVEVSEVYEVLNRHTAEKLGLSVPFPSRDEQ